MTDTIIATIPKNAKERIRIALTQFNGYELCAVRVFYDPQNGGDWLPGKSGINFRVEQLPEIIAALQRAAEASR
jgi:hypothetical protein